MMNDNLKADLEKEELCVYRAWLKACEAALNEGDVPPNRPALIYLERNL